MIKYMHITIKFQNTNVLNIILNLCLIPIQCTIFSQVINCVLPPSYTQLICKTPGVHSIHFTPLDNL